jgi:hypothetical protein
VVALKLDVFGRRLVIERHADRWVVFYLGTDGKRRTADDLFIPDAIPEDEVETYVADICHEWATPRNPRVVRLP